MVTHTLLGLAVSLLLSWFWLGDIAFVKKEGVMAHLLSDSPFLVPSSPLTRRVFMQTADHCCACASSVTVQSQGFPQPSTSPCPSGFPLYRPQRTRAGPLMSHITPQSLYTLAFGFRGTTCIKLCLSSLSLAWCLTLNETFKV